MSNEVEQKATRIAILGAGPIGLEAALYGRYLGYDVVVLEQGEVACNVRRWGHVKMFSPFAMNRSALGLAALNAQDSNATLPADDALLTGEEFVQAYLIPLSKSDLLDGCIHQHVTVRQIGRDGALKTDGDVDRSDCSFRILVEANGIEDMVIADVVIDSTGVFDQPNLLGHGGILAIGEMACQSRIQRHLPDVSGVDRATFEGKRVLVVGSGYSAATTVVALRTLQSAAPSTQVTWITRRQATEHGPLPVDPSDALPQRSELALQANHCASPETPGIEHLDQTSVVAVVFDEPSKRFHVRFGGKMEDEREFDVIVSNVGYRPNWGLLQELQVDCCPASDAIQPLARWLSDQGRVDALDQTAPGPASLRTSEPHFYVLGSKSFGRNSNFLLRFGLEQVRDVFTMIAQRDDLNLYATMAKLV